MKYYASTGLVDEQRLFFLKRTLYELTLCSIDPYVDGYCSHIDFGVIQDRLLVVWSNLTEEEEE